MSTTKIEWADRTWNPISGCTPISEGCANCYAARMAKRLAGRYGYSLHRPFEPGTLHPDKLDEPFKWLLPQKVFVCSMGDLFHENVGLSDLWQIHLKMRLYGRPDGMRKHTFMILTKRPQRMAEFYRRYPSYGFLDNRNLWLGVTAENQRTADERIPILLQIPAAKRFVSVEPMLGSVTLRPYLEKRYRQESGYRRFPNDPPINYLDWVIAGPETGPRARPTSIDWVRDLQRQCAAGHIPFFDKHDVLGETIQEWPR